MKDRYLFRGKAYYESSWVIGTYMYNSGDNLIHGHQFSLKDTILDENRCFVDYMVNPKTIGQCTGLKDKNGVLIFEGDKLDCIDIRETHTSEYSGVVVFEDYMWIVKNDECDTYLCYYDDSNCSSVTEIEITGNIHNEKAI